MYPILIVEDEPNIRNGLVNHAIWKELGIGSVLEADDGTTGLEKLREVPQIRLIVTDIRMKKMSGLELIRQLNDMYSYNGKIIILSGYDDFEYARTALTYGVIDYLLKPVDMSELKRTVAKAFDQLNREEWQRRSLNMVESAMPKLKEQLLQRLIESPSDAGTYLHVQKQLDACGLSWLQDSPPVLMALEPYNLRPASRWGDSAAERSLLFFAVGNVLEHTLSEYAETIDIGPYVIFRSMQGDRWIVLFGRRKESGMAERNRQQPLEAELRFRMARFVKIDVSIVFAAGSGESPAEELYRQAAQELMHARLYGSGEDQQEAESEESLRDIDLLSRAQALVDLLKHGERDDVEETMANFSFLVRLWNVGNLRDLHQRVFEWLLEVFEAAKKAGWNQDHWRRYPLKLWENIQSYDSVETLQAYAANELFQIHRDLQLTPRSQVLLKAEQYIREHFAEPLTIQAIADHVYVTPEWLSTLFKKHCRSTVHDYMTRLRMEQAKTLLGDVSLKIYQISGIVGYRDAVYFSKLFRKHTGLTPKEYRNEQGVRSDE